MKLEELESIILDASSSFRRYQLIEELSEGISKNRDILNQLYYLLSNKCNSFDNIKANSVLCSSCIHILIQSKRPESLFLLIQYIKSLPVQIPITYVEFLGKLLPFFGKIVIGPAKELTRYPDGTPQKAIGIQILCNLFLDGLLGEENYMYLIDLTQNYQNDPYFTKHLFDLVKSTNEYHNFIKSKNLYEIEPQDDIIIDDTIIIEKNSS
ncbi:MAG: hypothetical protein NZ853_09070 [Leptospiraceae bacterium]|nr:hypothetical protein [Leptospiraceae bacterium]MDW7975579.1 hypothetical protein [Leptospiraceae bacterium]